MNRRKKLFIFYIAIYIIVFIVKLPTFVLSRSFLVTVNILAYVMLFIIGITLYFATLKTNLNWIVHNKINALFILVLGYIGENIALLTSFFLIDHLGITETLINDSNIMNVSQTFSPVLIIFVLGLAGPIVEELFYRKIVITSFSKWLPSWFAILLSSFLFSCVHMHAITINELILVTPHFLSGIILGVLYKRTDNILFPIFLHVFSNVLSLLPLFMT